MSERSVPRSYPALKRQPSLPFGGEKPKGAKHGRSPARYRFWLLCTTRARYLCDPTSRLERDARKDLIEIPQRDGTAKRFPQSDLMEAFLYLVEVAVGDAPSTHEPEIFGALRNARDPAQRWMGTFYFDPTDIPAAEPVPDLSEPAIREDRF